MDALTNYKRFPPLRALRCPVDMSVLQVLRLMARFVPDVYIPCLSYALGLHRMIDSMAKGQPMYEEEDCSEAVRDEIKRWMGPMIKLTEVCPWMCLACAVRYQTRIVCMCGCSLLWGFSLLECHQQPASQMYICVS